ncbi:MAG: MFS transporter [Chloroflexota bacterium]
MLYVRLLRWLLRVDRPVAVRSEAEIAAEVARNYRWNFTVNLLDGASFWFGLSFVSASTIVPLFVTKLAAEAGLASPTLPVGLAAVIAQAGWFLPQLLTSNNVERLARKKPVVVNLGLFLERAPMWAIVLAALVAGRSAALSLVLFLLAYAWHGLGAGLVATAWQDLLARCFPVDKRGRFLGTTMFLGAGMGALGAGLSAWLLKSFPFPTNFVYTFTIAAAGISLSWVFLALTREPVQPSAAPRQSHRQFWRSLPAIIRQDVNFRRFLTGRLTLALGSMGSGFVTVAALQKWQVSDSTVATYTAAYLAGQTAGNLGFGFLADRFGHKLSLELSGLASALAFGLAWLAPSPGWYYLVFVLLGVNLGAILVSGILVTLEFCEPPRRPTYVGIANTGVGLAGGLAPLLGAGLAEMDYDWLFVASVAVNGLAFFIMRWWVREPRYHTAGQKVKLET